MKCPECDVKYSNLPKTERKLMQIQDLYYENDKDEKYMTLLVKEMLEYTKSLIKKRYSVYVRTEGIDYFAQNAVSFVVEEYYKADYDYRIIKSFGGFLNLKIKQALFAIKERLHDDISMNWHFEDNHLVNYEDTGYHMIEDIEERENRRHLLKYISELLFGIEKYCDNPRENYLRLIALWRNLENGENAADKLFRETEYKRDKDGEFVLDNQGNKKIKSFKTYGRSAKIKYLETLEIFEEELRELEKD